MDIQRLLELPFRDGKEERVEWNLARDRAKERILRDRGDPRAEATGRGDWGDWMRGDGWKVFLQGMADGELRLVERFESADVVWWVLEAERRGSAQLWKMLLTFTVIGLLIWRFG